MSSEYFRHFNLSGNCSISFFSLSLNESSSAWHIDAIILDLNDDNMYDESYSDAFVPDLLVAQNTGCHFSCF